MSDSENDDQDDDTWYWLVLSQPEYFWLAKSFGGKPAKQADRAMETLVPAFAILVVVLVVAGLVYIVIKALGLPI